MNEYKLPRSHPRYQSLHYRDLLADGVRDGIVSLQGLTAHGRGEAFDYLLGEKTHEFAEQAIEASASLLLLADYPVFSVNGNTAVLVPDELITLARLVNAVLEINLFHASKKREKAISQHLKQHGAKKVLIPCSAKIPGIESNRKMISSDGQAKSDVIFVPLEDGDRTEALVAMGKKVITVDLNPLSRTAQNATITIVDNIVRVLPILTEKVREMKRNDRAVLTRIVSNYNNEFTISLAEKVIRKGNFFT